MSKTCLDLVLYRFGTCLISIRYRFGTCLVSVLYKFGLEFWSFRVVTFWDMFHIEYYTGFGSSAKSGYLANVIKKL